MEDLKKPEIKVSDVVQSRDFAKSLYLSFLVKKFDRWPSGFLVQTDENIDSVNVNLPGKIHRIVDERQDFRQPSGWGFSGNPYYQTLMTVRFDRRIPTIRMLFENRTEKNMNRNLAEINNSEYCVNPVFFMGYLVNMDRVFSFLFQETNDLNDYDFKDELQGRYSDLTGNLRHPELAALDYYLLPAFRSAEKMRDFLENTGLYKAEMISFKRKKPYCVRNVLNEEFEDGFYYPTRHNVKKVEKFNSELFFANPRVHSEFDEEQDEYVALIGKNEDYRYLDFREFKPFKVADGRVYMKSNRD